MESNNLRKTVITGVVVLFFITSTIPNTIGNPWEMNEVNKVREKEVKISSRFDAGTRGAAIYVGGFGPDNYSTIQGGINAASDGDTVYVYNGIYHENVIIDKTINLIGGDKNTTIIDGSGNGTVIYVFSADQVNITGFTITGSAGSCSPTTGSGIKLYDAHNCYIVNNNISSNNVFGIYLEYSLTNSFVNNIINNNNYGIYIYWSSGNAIINNTINNNNYSIYATHSPSNKITGNTGNDNDYGIYICYRSDGNTLTTNTVNNNDYGIHIRYHSYNNIFTNNTVNNNDYGIYLASDCSSNILTKNIVTNNHYGLYIGDWVNNNIIYRNNFINNNQNAYDNGYNIWYSETFRQGNYWDDYEGVDSDGDGIGDTPYNISGGSNQDLYPLMASYPSVDLIITDFSAEYYSQTALKLTATIKNIGNVDIAIPFQVSFYGSTENNDSRIIGTLEVSLLESGETAEATIYWKLKPEIHIIQVFADSTRIIEESDEDNNWASITVSYILWNSLIETVDVYTLLSQKYATHYAEKIADRAEKALQAGVWMKPQKYVQEMETIAEYEYGVGIELEGQMPDSLLLHNYQFIVEYLITLIDELTDNHHTTPGITWEDAEVVAETQLKLCEIVMQMLR